MKLPLATIKPPNTNTSCMVKEPSIFATTCVLPTAAMNRNKEIAI